MSDNQRLVMHPDFPRWYRTVSLEDDRERVRRRFSGLSALIKTPTRADVESWVRVAFRARQGASPEALARIRQPFKEVDDLFDMQGNERELEILCGSALAILFERDGDISATGALAVTTAALNGARSPELPMDLPVLAEHAIGRIAEVNRKRPNLSQHIPAATPKVDFSAAMAKVQQQPDWSGVAAAFGLAAEAVQATLAPIAQQSAASIERANTFIAIQDEELQMLWWVFGERSTDLDCPFKDVTPTERQPLLFAKELADATEFPPGPSSAKALLARTGLRERERLTIPVAVNACDASWLGSLAIQRDVSPVSAPVHTAIFRKLETGDDTSWVSGWAAVSGIDQNYSLSALTLGNLFYRERLLALFSKE